MNKMRGLWSRAGLVLTVLLQRVKAPTCSFNTVPYNNMPVKASHLASESSLSSTVREQCKQQIQSSSLTQGKQQANPKTWANNPRKQCN